MRMPRLRFRADDGSEFPDWEERTSVELCSRMIGGGTPSTSNTGNYNGDISWISSSDLDVDNITTVRRTRFITEGAVATSATKKVKPGSIAVVLRVGVGKVALLDRETCTSQDFISLEGVTGDTKFIAYMLSARMQREAVRTQGTSIKGIPATRFKELTYRMPPSIIEQRKIADLLSTVDDVIVVQQTEVDAWEQRKKGVMQKLFSQEVRFKADDGSDFPDWEEKTLGDVGTVAMCKRVFKEQTSAVGDVPFFKIGTFGGTPDAYISRSLFNELKSKYPYPKVGTILLSASGTIGRQVVYNGEDAYYQDSNIVWLEHDDTVLDSYLRQFYAVVKWQGLEGSTIKRLYNKTILDTPFCHPSLPEQRKIANCLSSLDDVIVKAKAELTKWQELKKGLLQQIFV